MDECKYNISDCDVNANCTNTYSSYKCTCKAGYSGDGHSCSGTVNFPHPRWPWMCFSINCFSSPLCEVSSWHWVQLQIKAEFIVLT